MQTLVAITVLRINVVQLVIMILMDGQITPVIIIVLEILFM